MSIDLLEKAGIGNEDIEAIKQAGVEVTFFEGLNNRFLFYGLTVRKIEIAVNNGEIRDKDLLKKTVKHAINTNNLNK